MPWSRDPATGQWRLVPDDPRAIARDALVGAVRGIQDAADATVAYLRPTLPAARYEANFGGV
jgi:hypothetical protein